MFKYCAEKHPKTPPPISFITHFLLHTPANRFLFSKYLDEDALHATDRLSWRDLAGSVQGLSFCLNEPGQWQDLTRFVSEKKSSAPPGQSVLLSAVFPLFIEICGAGCLSQGKGGAKREEIQVKREFCPTGTWGRNSQLAEPYIAYPFNKYNKLALVPNGHLCHNLIKAILINLQAEKFDWGLSPTILNQTSKSYMYFTKVASG